MVAGALEPSKAGAIDWSAPWFDAVGAAGRTLEPLADRRAALNDAAERLGIRNAAGPIRFVAADAAGGTAYESYIARTGAIPTRDNRHDFFNALVWLSFPRTKARLNALQAAAIAAVGIGRRRGALRDAATLVDENALLLVTRRDDLIDALRRHDWPALFVERRSAWHAEVRPLVFGHALMEKLTAPYKAITAHALAVRLPPTASQAEVDAQVADALDAGFTPRALMPLPVLGIPGWADNDAAGFYEDPAVFRPVRRAASALVQSMRG